MSSRWPTLFSRSWFLLEGWAAASPVDHTVRDEEMATKQLVLPMQCRKAVLDVAHDISFSGHLGKGKTAQHILQRFYWPTLYHDVAAYHHTCEVCQKTS